MLNNALTAYKSLVSPVDCNLSVSSVAIDDLLCRLSWGLGLDVSICFYGDHEQNVWLWWKKTIWTKIIRWRWNISSKILPFLFGVPECLFPGCSKWPALHDSCGHFWFPERLLRWSLKSSWLSKYCGTSEKYNWSFKHFPLSKHVCGPVSIWDDHHLTTIFLNWLQKPPIICSDLATGFLVLDRHQWDPHPDQRAAEDVWTNFGAPAVDVNFYTARPCGRKFQGLLR